MDNELTDGMDLAVSLIVISAVIGLILLFAGIGQQYERSTVASVSDVIASSYASEIEALRENADTVPVATVYLVIVKNEGLVKSVTGRIQGENIDDAEDLKLYFSRKVTVTIDDTPQGEFIFKVEG